MLKGFERLNSIFACFLIFLLKYFHYHQVFFVLHTENQNISVRSCQFSFSSFLTTSFIAKKTFRRKNMESLTNCRILEISVDCTNQLCVVISLLWGFFL